MNIVTKNQNIPSNVFFLKLQAHLQSWTERVENFLQRRTNKDYNYFRASNTTPPPPPRVNVGQRAYYNDLVFEQHWFGGGGGRGVSNGSYPRILILDVTKYDNKSNFLNYFVHDCNHGQKGLRIFYSDEQIRTTTTFAHQTQPHPLPPESMLVNAHTTMIWCSNNIGLGGEGGLKWKLSTYFDTGCYKV